MPVEDKPAVYLSFDDGPHPEATVFALDELKKHDAKASFFCIGKNVVAHGDLYNRIVSEGHTVGNHTHNHLNGWHNSNHQYYTNILKASKHVEGHNFRPPYGRIKISQARKLSAGKHQWKVYMWDVLSGDFDTALSPEQCLQNVLDNIESGSIVVFHDSEKAFPRMKYALPLVLQYCKEMNWQLKALPK